MINSKLKILPLLLACVSVLTFVVGLGEVLAESGMSRIIARRGSPEKKAAAISISHIAPKPDELPYPGQKMNLRIQLRGTKETERQLRLLVVRDGRLIDISVNNTELNEHDIPTYQVSLNAPLAEMTYQILLYNPDGTVTVSQRYSVRRNCIPNVELAQGEVKPEILGIERLQRLVNEAKHLEYDLAGYDQVLSLLDGLQNELNGGKK